MMRKYLQRIFTALCLCCILLAACSEDSTSLGVDMMPASDLLLRQYRSYGVPTESYAVEDSVLSRTSKSYLGFYTDPETGTSVRAEFISQYHINENEQLFAESVVDNKITDFYANLYVEKFIGDSLTNFNISVYDLNKNLDSEADYYTDIECDKYCDMTATPLATKWYTLADRILTEKQRTAKGYLRCIRVKLPLAIGQQIYDAFRTNKSLFANTRAWLNSGLPCSKGLYYKVEYGDGAIAYIDISQLAFNFRYYDKGYKKDTTGITYLSATEEVVQATSFDNTNLEPLLNDEGCTYLKSPAGIFTLATLPIDSINVNDTINAATLTFTRYNDQIPAKFKLGIPQTLLLVRYDDYKKGYFEKYQKADDKTSFLAKFNSSGNNYTFTNISRLIATCLKEKQKGKATPTYNKVLLIPVETTYDSSNKLVKLNHDFSVCSAKLVKGHSLKPGEKGEDDSSNVLLKVVYSSFTR